MDNVEIARLILSELPRTNGEAKLTCEELIALLYIEQKVRTYPREMAFELGLPEATVSHMLTRMERARFLTRHKENIDRRHNWYRLTAKGKRLRARARHRSDDAQRTDDTAS